MVENPVKSKTCQLHCRVPVEVYEAVRARAEGKHALGALVSEAIQAHLWFLTQNYPSPEEIAKAVLTALKGKL